MVAYAAAHLDGNLSLAALAAQAGLSEFHLQRVFADEVGETPKQLALRLRLDRAAAMLLSGDQTILDTALACGFESHEAFIRAFRRRFQMTPSAYRKRGFAGAATLGEREVKRHCELVEQMNPCVGMYRASEQPDRRNAISYTVSKKEIAAQPVLLLRRRIQRTEMAQVLGPAFHQIGLYAGQKGLAIAGQPLTRFIDCGVGLWTIEAGMPVVSRSKNAHAKGVSLDENTVTEGMLHAGPVAVATHIGPYDQLQAAHSAVQKWMEEQRLKLREGEYPWEVYVTDPADYPNPNDWRTDIFWPVKR